MVSIAMGGGSSPTVLKPPDINSYPKKKFRARRRDRKALTAAGRRYGMIRPALDGRVALVTGSARGLGAAITLALAEAGADVAVHYNSSEAAARATAAEAREADVSATVVQADVTDPDAVDAAFSTVESELGHVDVLINNVGDFAPSHWADLEFETWRRVTETNYYGTYLCSKRALPGMREAGWGRIVNVGYAGADRALVDAKNFPYFVAKTGVLMFTRMLANDTAGDGITVNAVSPYVVESSDRFPEEAPRGRWASFDDVVQAVAFFLDEGSSYLSGENVAVDGGWLPETL
jgi:NAD(P)-dependent dehydrogenase (short-subunit alcohol dehydrogenase family)